MVGARDTQRSKLYRAERACRAIVGDVAIRDRLTAWAFIEKVERDKWFRRTYGRWTFRISDGRGTSIARGGGGRLNLPRWSRTPMVMLHEIAHNVVGAHHAHDWVFAATFLRLVRHFMGKDVHDRLRASFRTFRVRYKAPRPARTLSPEARAALCARLAVMRSRRQMAANTPPPA